MDGNETAGLGSVPQSIANGNAPLLAAPESPPIVSLQLIVSPSGLTRLISEICPGSKFASFINATTSSRVSFAVGCMA